MICPEVHKEVARLDGYLDGIAASANGSRRYSAGAFLIELAEPDACIEQAIRDCKSWYSQLAFAQTGRQRLPRGLAFLQHDLRLKTHQRLSLCHRLARPRQYTLEQRRACGLP